MTPEQMIRDALAKMGIRGPMADEVLTGIRTDTSQLGAYLRGEPVTQGALVELERAIEHAQTFYHSSSKGQQRITGMADGHIHNSCAGLKRRHLGGVHTFTILAMDAEILRREEAAKAGATGA